MNNYLELGKISGFFGVKGWVKIFSYTRPRIGIADYKEFYLGEAKTPIVFTEIKESSKHVVGHIKDIDDRDDAIRFQEQILYVKREDLPQLDNEYYWHQLIGLTVVNQQGDVLGKICEMMETGANDVIVIRNDNNEETLIPYVMSHFVLSVDLSAGEMVVDWERE